MRYIVPGFVHRRGIHCGSAAMQAMLAFRGIRLSEPMCFGLGSGAWFYYVPDHPVPPGVTFHGRLLEMEKTLCSALAVPFPERTERDAEEGWRRARGALLAGNPVLISTDLAHLDYFETKTHFSGHRVVLAGVDDEAGAAILSDSEREDLQPVPIESLKRSRASAVPPYPMENRWCVIVPEAPLRPLSEAVLPALRRNARAMLHPERRDVAGIPGMRRVADDLPRWPAMTKDWVFAARFGYQVIEKRGTGGGFFRRLYARYLEEAETFCPAVSRAGLPGSMAALADRWAEIAGRLKEISESGDPSGFSTVADLFRRAADAEETFWTAAGRAAGE
jgi:hypothetical protein